MRSVFIALCFTMIAGFAQADTPVLSEQEAKFVELLNAERSERKLQPLAIDADLSVASKTWSRTMTRSGFRHGVSYENIARGTTTAEGALRMWMNSPRHRDFLFSPNNTVMGIGQTDSFWVFRALGKQVERTKTVTREVIRAAPKPMVCTPSACVPAKVETFVPKACTGSYTSGCWYPGKMLKKILCCR